jgi:hypothetical protein
MTKTMRHPTGEIVVLERLPMQVKLKDHVFGSAPRRAIEQIVGYKNDPGNGYTRIFEDNTTRVGRACPRRG